MSFETQAPSDVSFVQLPLEYSKDRRRGIGVVAPFDFALDDELWRWLPAEVSLYVTRTARLENTAVTEELAQEVSSVAAVTPPVRSLISAEPASIAYACTSGSFIDGLKGEAELCNIMEQASGISAVTTSGALLMALSKLGIRRIAIATPYNESLTRDLADFLESAGIEVVKAGYLNSEHDIMHIGYDAVRTMAEMVNHDKAEAVFFSCTNLRTFDVIEELEERLGKPILSANQVTMWAALRKANLAMPNVPQRLFEEEMTKSIA